MHQRLLTRVRAVYIGLMAPLLGVAVFVAVFVSLAAPAAAATTSSNLNFQARILGNNGGVVPDGNYNIDFKIYNADSTTGSVGTCTGACLWEETRKNSNSQGVQVINGYFSVNLGSVTAFPAINWDQQLWLTMNIGGTSTGASPTWDGEMQNSGHSIALTALPYSFVAGQLAKTSGANRGTLNFGTLLNNPAITLPDASGTVCLQAASACGFESTTGTDFIQNQNAVLQTANFNISGTGAAGTLQTSTLQAAAAAALTITGHAASNWTVDSGNLTVDATGAAATLNLGTGAQAKTIQIGNITGAVAQTINIGNNTTGSSTDNVTIGNLLSTSATLIQGGTGASAIGVQTGTGGTISIGTSSVGTVSIGSTGTVNIGSGNANTTNVTGSVLVTAGGSNAFRLKAGTNDTTLNIDTSSDSANLITSGQGNFEGGTSGWSRINTNGTIGLNPSNAYLGGGSLDYTANGGGSGGAKYAVALSATQYTLTVYARAVGSNFSTFEIGFANSTAGGPVSCLTGQTVVTTGWTKFTCTFTPVSPNAAQSYVYAQQTDSAARDWLIDAVKLVQAAPASSSPFRGSSVTFDAVLNGVGVFQNVEDSNTAFQIQNAAGGSNLFIADTLDNKIGIGGVPTASGATLQVTGSVSATSTITGTTLNGTTGINTGSGAGTQRIDSSGNLVAIGNFTATAGSTFTSGGANGFTFKPGTDNAAAFQVQKAGSVNAVAAVDTSGNQLVLGTAGSSGINGKLVFNTTNASGTSISISAASTGSSYSLILPTTGPSLSQCLQNDGTTTGQLTFGPCGATGTFVNFAPSSVQADSTTNNSVFINKTGASGNILELQKSGNDVFSVSNNGSVAVQNSTQKQVFGVNTSTNQTVLGQANNLNGSLLFQNSSSSNGITINSTATSSNYTLTLPTVAPAGGLCIETSTGAASQLIFASCSNNNASIQEVHEWDANNTNIVAVSPTTAGNEMVLTTQIPTGGVTVSSVSGGGVTTWSKVVTSAGNGTVNRVEMWVGTVITTGSSNITVTYSSSPGAEEITATEFTAAGVNVNTSWGIESSSSQLNSSASTTVTYPNMTAVNGSELYVGYAQVQNPPATSGSSTGFNYIQTSTQHNMIAYNTSLAANTAYQPTANQNSSGQSNTVAAILTAFVTSSAINNTTSLQKANYYVQAATSGTVAGVLQAASSGTADILDLRDSGANNVLSVGSTGNVLVQPAASATAFQVQNGSNFGVMTVDTSGNQVILGDATHLSGKITFKDSGDSNTISFVAPTSVASSYSLTLPNNTPTAGLCLGTSPSNANQLIFASCATSVSAASISYINKWDNHGTSVTTIADSPASIGNLLVFYSHTANAVSINSISGGGVTNWTKVTAYTGGGTPGNIEMWRGVVTTAGAGTVTVTYSATAGTNEIVAQEFSMGSASGTWAIDTSGTATTTSSVTTANYPSLTPLNSSELYTGYAYGGGTMSTGSTSGFTYVATGATKYLAYNTNVTGGTAYAPTAPQTSGVYASVAAVIAAYAGTSVIVNSTAVQQANFNVQAATSGTIAGILQAASSGTADVLQVKDSSGNNVMSVNSSTGLTLGTSNVIGGQLIFNSSGNSNNITIQAPTAPGASYSLTLPTTTPAPGQCLATSPSNANQLVFSSCANQVTSVAISFVNNWKTSTGGNPATLSVSPANVGDLMVLFVSFQKADSVNSGGVSGGGCTAWSKIASTGSGSGTDTTSIEMYRCQTTSSGASTISVNWSGPAATNELAAMEFTTGSNTGSWVVDSSNTQFNSSSTTVTYPSLTPQSSKDLYVGYGSSPSTASAGSSSGFTYLSGSLTNREGLYNTSVSTTTQPTSNQSSSGASLTVGALVAAYSSSSVISNSTVTQEGNFNVQAATSGSVAGVLQAFGSGSGDIFDLLDGPGTLVDSFSSTGNLLVKPSTASAAAFQVQTTGGVNVLSADTSGKSVVIGAGSAGESSPSLLVLDNETGTIADPTVLNGAMYYNATNHTFRCGVDGIWQNCTGLLYSNTSNSSANSNCSSACVAFSTAAAIPANYCQPGRVINLTATGYFSSQATATTLQFGIYYGTDASIAGNDTLIGSLSPSQSVTAASNNYFQMNFNIICFSTSSMQAEGFLNFQAGAAGAGMTVVPMNSTSGTTVVTSSAKNLYLFPIWGAASSSNTATITQLQVNGL